MRYTKPTSAALLLLSVSLQRSHAFFDTITLNCKPLTIQRSDPLVSPGVASGHVHAVVGGNAFSRNMSAPTAATVANFTTCDKYIDRSSYWVPNLYHHRTDGWYDMVDWTGSAIYYQNRACNYTTATQYCNKSEVALAFPEGFRMIAGSSSRRTINLSDQAELAVTVMCETTKGSTQYVGFPPEPCVTFRAQIYFPSCWDGVNLDTPNHQDHVAYPAIGAYDGGICPQSHPVALISIFYEFFFDTSPYPDFTNLIFSNGDTTGYGFHGDFINGWTNITALQGSFVTCDDFNPACSIRTNSTVDVQEAQPLIHPAIYEEEVGLNGPISTLAGNPPIWTATSTAISVPSATASS